MNGPASESGKRRPLVVGSRRRSGRGVPAARLQCGGLSTYEEVSFVPMVGDMVPCRRHGFCVVDSTERARRSVPGCPTPARRTTAELVAFLSRHGTSTVGLLRKHRFTLRVVSAAQRDGLVDVDVDVDLIEGRVELRSTRRSPSQLTS